MVCNPRWPIYLVTLLMVFLATLLNPARVEATSTPCARPGAFPQTRVTIPTEEVSWRAAPLSRVPVYGPPASAGGRRGFVGPLTAEWLLVLGATTDRKGRCWVAMRLPGRPNTSRGWVEARRVALQQTKWRLVVELGKRRLSVYRQGRLRHVFSVVVGARSTPTPRGLFSIVHAWRGSPGAFVGSWILGLTAHSNVLRRFEGGNGEVGIHGRGGASLLDPLGSAASHGCIRMANGAIDWLVRTVGQAGLPGIPVVVVF